MLTCLLRQHAQQPRIILSKTSSMCLSHGCLKMLIRKFEGGSPKCWRPVREKLRIVFSALTESCFTAFGVALSIQLRYLTLSVDSVQISQFSPLRQFLSTTDISCTCGGRTDSHICDIQITLFSFYKNVIFWASLQCS